jgi:hypothetical protein
MASAKVMYRSLREIPREIVDQGWPNLASQGVTYKSCPDGFYNCVAWAAEVNDDWWWPPGESDGFWPDGHDRSDLGRGNFIGVFEEVLGYRVCADGVLEDGYQKVVIYERDGIVTHMARQLSDGQWTSKMGIWEDVTHQSLEAMAGGEYGDVVVYMKRPIKGSS